MTSRLNLIVIFILQACALTAPCATQNVLLIVSDDLTACLGCYGHPVCKTPNLDRLAKSGVRFERAYCQFPVCGPSRSSFMSGLYPATTKMLVNEYNLGAYKSSNPELADHPSIGGLLRQNGYFSARISKIYHLGIPGGLESGSAGGDEPDSWDWTYNVMAPETYTPGKLLIHSPKLKGWGTCFASLEVADEHVATQADRLSTAQAVAFLENRSGSHPNEDTVKSRQKMGAPFFLAVGLVRPHVPLIAPERLYRQYPAAEMAPPELPDDNLAHVPKPVRGMTNKARYGMTEEGKRVVLSGYYASVTFMDEQVGEILDTLERLKLRENTLVIFTSDHGYNLGEHDCWQKQSLFEETTRVPFIVSSPEYAANAGKKSGAIVELVDLYPTVCDLVGLKEKIPARVQGVSLRPLLEKPDRADWARNVAYTVARDKGESIRTSRWRYNIWEGEGEELYDHDNDPGEFVNLVDSAEHAMVLKELRGELDSARRRASGAGGESSASGADVR